MAEPNGREISNIEKILSGIERINTMLSDESHRAYAVRVLENVDSFIAARRKDLTAGKATALQFWLLKVAKSLAVLPDEFKATANSEVIRSRIDAAAVTFLG